jgi:hypothetical protein
MERVTIVLLCLMRVYLERYRTRSVHQCKACHTISPPLLDPVVGVGESSRTVYSTEKHPRKAVSTADPISRVAEREPNDVRFRDLIDKDNTSSELLMRCDLSRDGGAQREMSSPVVENEGQGGEGEKKDKDKPFR